jgi:mono/diheme cytochrome c family protein
MRTLDATQHPIPLPGTPSPPKAVYPVAKVNLRVWRIVSSLSKRAIPAGKPLKPILKWALAAGGIVFVLALLAAALIWLEAEAVIERRYPLASTTAAASEKSKAVARGAHLVTIAGCADCHGRDLEGRLLDSGSALPVWSSNLRLLARSMSDDEFERAIRDGLLPDATSTWAMPSYDYTYMSEDDVVGIISYLRTLAPLGTAKPAPDFDMKARLAIVREDLVPVASRTQESSSSLDLGSRYDGGRYLARVACSDCHDTDLTGSAQAPDLTIVARYDRSAFFALLRGGRSVDGHRLATMPRLTGSRFHGFYDYEIDALYDYLAARAKVLRPRTSAHR